ncbi:Cathepsin_L [Hexamita inflata]|uniref:Cathepsin L n=1 Tax=Hexamita inflata TaxID=28002 RepID=A0AA86P8K8_9EUKA|nr:Cathepsin L [Hexamita inflata]
MLIISLALTCSINKTETCSDAYNKFVVCFNKSKSEERKLVFCRRFQYYVKHGGLIQPMMDSEIPSSQRKQLKVIPKASTEVDCQEYYCYASNVLKDLTHIYESVDLREAGLSNPAQDQGNCSSCWVFTMTSLMENSIKLQQFDSSQQFWAMSRDLSEQFILSNTFGPEYCGESDLMVGFDYFNKNIETVEISANFVYNPSYKFYKDSFAKNISLKPKIDKSLYLKPFKTFSVIQDNTQTTPVIGIHTDEEEIFTSSTIWTIKSYLSRGIVIGGAMQMSNKNMDHILTLDGSVVQNIACDMSQNPIKNHQITIIGYGRKNGQEVWIIKNSYGQYWGGNGHLFVPIGKNSLCSEMYAIAIIPLTYDLSSTNPYFDIGSHTRGNYYDLDRDDCDLIDSDNDTWILAIEIMVPIFGVGTIGGVFVIKHKKKQYKNVNDPKNQPEELENEPKNEPGNDQNDETVSSVLE